MSQPTRRISTEAWKSLLPTKKCTKWYSYLNVQWLSTWQGFFPSRILYYKDSLSKRLLYKGRIPKVPANCCDRPPPEEGLSSLPVNPTLLFKSITGSIGLFPLPSIVTGSGDCPLKDFSLPPGPILRPERRLESSSFDRPRRVIRGGWGGVEDEDFLGTGLAGKIPVDVPNSWLTL